MERAISTLSAERRIAMNYIFDIVLILLGYIAGVFTRVVHDTKSEPDDSYEIGYLKGWEDAKK